MSADEARRWCRNLVRRQYENFSVLSSLVPARLRDDFAAVYAFCRWADDLGDEVGDPSRSLELLAWWRRELQDCFAGAPRHPVFAAMLPTIKAHDLPIAPFDDLIQAFELDQTKSRYRTWQELLDYCRLSANPVGRIVLMLCGEERAEHLYKLSDCTCTALQLTNHWQDVKRDFLDRDRVYIPQQLIEIVEFEPRLARSARQGYAVDRTFLEESRAMVRRCVDRTWPLYERGAGLLDALQPHTKPIVDLLASGGQHVLRMIEFWNYETVLHRPKLSKARRLVLMARAWVGARRARRTSGAVAALPSEPPCPQPRHRSQTRSSIAAT